MSSLDELTRLISTHEETFRRALEEADAVAPASRTSAIDGLKVAWTGRKSGRIAELMAHLPDGPPLYPEGEVTDEPTDTRIALDSAVSEGEVAFDGLEELVTESARLTWRFRPDGGALGDTVVVRGQEGSLVLSVDRWNGVARTDAQ